MIIIAFLILLVILFAILAVRASAGKPASKPRHPVLSRMGCLFLAGVTFLVLASVALGPSGHPTRYYLEMDARQTTRTLALAMFQFANDNNGNYPDGTSSTEVFQELMDGNYINDPHLLYVPMWGKTPAKQGAKLRHENVCFDVTSGIGNHAPDSLPIVFLTGYRMEYKPDGNAISLIKPAPMFRDPPNAWFFWERSPFGGIAVGYFSNASCFLTKGAGYLPDVDPNVILVVPHVVPVGFDAHGKTYRQLTPEGVLK